MYFENTDRGRVDVEEELPPLTRNLHDSCHPFCKPAEIETLESMNHSDELMNHAHVA